MTTIAGDEDSCCSVDCVVGSDKEEIPHPTKSDEVTKNKVKTENIDREVFITHPSKRKR